MPKKKPKLNPTIAKATLPIRLEARRIVHLSEGDTVEYAASIDTGITIEVKNNPNEEQTLVALGTMLNAIVYNAVLTESEKGEEEKNETNNDVS